MNIPVLVIGLIVIWGMAVVLALGAFGKLNGKTGAYLSVGGMFAALALFTAVVVTRALQ